MNKTLVRGLIARAVILAGMLLGSVARADELPFTATGFIPGLPSVTKATIPTIHPEPATRLAISPGAASSI
jgi:hypothetical protein